MKVFVFDPLWTDLLSSENRDMLEAAGIDVNLTTKIDPLDQNKTLFSTEDKILAINPDYVGWSLPAEKFAHIPHLKCIITQSTSYGWIDTAHAKKMEIPVVNIRNFSTDAVADWAILMMLNVARKIPLLIKAGFPLNFGDDFQIFQGTNLKGKKVGIIGLGNIGQAIAQRCQGLGMDVIYWSKTQKDVPYKFATLEDVFSSSDIIFPCMADNEDTRGIITDSLIKSMQTKSMLISIVHKLFNHDLVVDMVKQKQIFGYGFESEPGSFMNFEGNIWAAPAYAWCTDGSMRKSMDLFVRAICDAANGQYPSRVV